MKRFLKIDDNGQDLDAVLKLLREHGYAAHEVTDEQPDVSSALLQSEQRCRDIRAEEELRRSNEVLRAIIEAAPTAIIGVDLDGNVRHVWNPAAEKLLGWAAEEVMGRPLPSVPVESQEEFRRFREWIRSGKTMGGVEVRRQRRDGTPIDYSIYASPLRDGEGRIIGNIAVLVDISQRKQMEEALRYSENRYRLIVETAEEGIWQVDREWKTAYVNRRMEQMVGCEPGAMIGLHIFDFMDDEGRREALKLMSRRERGERETHDFRFYNRDGSCIDTLVCANPLFDEHGDFSGAIAMVTNITERKRAEEALLAKTEELDRYFTHALDLFCIADTDGYFRRLNKEWETALGYPISELEGTRFLDYVHPADMDATLGAIARLDAQEELLNFVNRYRAKDGSYRWIEWRSFPAGKLIYAAARDITERLRVNELQQEHLARLQTMVRNAPIVLYGVDRNGIFTLSEGKGLAGMGLKPGEVVGRSAFEIYRDQPEGLENFRRALAGETFTAPVHTATRVYDAYHEPVYGDQGEYAGTFGVLVDVTERTQAEEALRQANMVVENSPVVLFRWRAAEGWPVEMVSSNITQFGYTPEELLSGMVPFCSIVYPDDLERVSAEVADYTRRGEDRFQQEYRIITKEGNVRWIDDRTVVERDEGGSVIHYQGIVMDITDRKRTEIVITARMRLLQFAATHTLDELLQAALDEAEKLTGSTIGFYHFLEADQKTLSLQNWSTRTKKEFCKAQGKGRHYDVASAGVWVDCIHQRCPVIHNDYASLPHRKGLPPGHAPVVRELVVPVFRGGSIEAIFGVGNKRCDYTSQDVETVSLLADLAWGVVGIKRAEEALMESERKFRTIVEYAPFGICRSTRNGKLISANPRMAALLKYDSPEQLLEAVNRAGVQEVLFAEPSRRGPIVDQIFSSDSWNTFENRYRCRDGSVITCRVNSRRILDQEGGETEFESFLENITERLEAEKALKESEEKFRVLAETAPAAIIVYQGDKLVYVNPAATRLFGYSEGELLEMNFWEWVPEETRETIRERGLARQRGEQAPSQYEQLFVNKKGEKGWAMVSAGTIEYRGKPAGIATLIDITETKRVEEQLGVSLKEKEILLKEVHHRVKNNMQIISSLLDLQSDSIADKDSRRFILESQNRIRSMALVHEKLYQSESFATIDFRNYLDSLTQYLFDTFVRDPDLIRLTIDAEDISLRIDEAIPCGLIINELVSNSLKHAFPNGMGGEITVRCRSDEWGRVTLSVTDNGIGLPPGLDVTHTGTLGLQIVTMLVKQLRGDMKVDAAGATFVISFPSSSTNI